MKENNNIEQLFRKEFETFEVQPSKKVWRGVRTNLFIRNFLHFSPRNLNIWYVSGIIILTSAVVFNLTRPEERISKRSESEISSDIPAGSDSLSLSKVSATRPEALNSNSIHPDASTSKTGRNNKNQSFSEVSEGITKTWQAINVAANVTENPGNLDKESIINFNGQSVIAWFEILTPEGCVPLSAGFRNLSQNAIRYFWSFGDGGSSELPNPCYIYDEPGTWFISLTAYSSTNEISIFTDSIKVSPLPEARFSMDLQGLADDGQPVYFYNYSRGAENYIWDFGDGSGSNLKEPDHYFNRKVQTDIKLLALSSAGCCDSIILKNAFKEGEPVFIFPTAFSPNQNGAGSGQYSTKDQSNDVFYPYLEEEPEEYQLRIYSRNGIQIFESNDVRIGWDGYYHEELQPQGVYVWKARATFADGRSVVKMGDITLVWGNER